MTPMSEPSIWAKTLFLGGVRFDLQLVSDEIFLDLREGPGTQVLAGTCYGQAVLDCRVVGSDYFLLHVRPDMRGLLLSQLKKVYKAFRVYHFRGDTEGRILLTDELVLRFSPAASPEERRESLRRFFPGGVEEANLEDGIYRLSGTFAEDPILVSNALQANSIIVEAAPLIVALPKPLGDEGLQEIAAEVSSPEAVHTAPWRAQPPP